MKHSRGFVLLMAAVMTMTMFPTGALAAEGEYTVEETEVEETATVLLQDEEASLKTYSICFDAGDGFFYNY